MHEATATVALGSRSSVRVKAVISTVGPIYMVAVIHHVVANLLYAVLALRLDWKRFRRLHLL